MIYDNYTFPGTNTGMGFVWISPSDCSDGVGYLAQEYIDWRLVSQELISRNLPMFTYKKLK